MANESKTACPPTDDPVELDFRKKNQWYSFTGAVFGAVGTAAFIGLLGTVANGLVNMAAGETAAAALFSAAPLMVMGGLLAVGAAAIYMSQREYTELKCLGDDHLAHRTAIENGHQLQHTVQKAPVEYLQNRLPSDGRTWLQVSGKDNPVQQAAIPHR